MDQIGAHGYNIALAIGGKAKRRFLARGGLPLDDFAVSLRKASHHTLLFDCEMHLQPDGAMPRIIAGPRRGHYAYHLIKPPQRASQFAFGLYYNVYSNFGGSVIIFVADFGAKQVLHFLYFWMRCAKAEHDSRRSRIILITNESQTTPRLDDFQFVAAMISELRKDEPTTPYSAKDVKRMIHSYFDFTIVPGVTDLCDEFWQSIASPSASMAGGRDCAPPCKRALFRAAISQFVRQPLLPFDAILASRISNPIPKEFEENLA
ncbi:hypothetical protein HRG_006924 [Hirsutella rhossiliensis]|uniref:Uncharacterized protein n=1 Tax=Hirsutella rhossiliensis TaxID=111463 RepID=A0A9P8MWT7_9HYPO|nr:uncharacterized protein HRG_06924 [Hirsutella rhossiliensis]KAH0961844.1 hypothetical protein HRG_06924 [Hirsutella rhossiliensis]